MQFGGSAAKSGGGIDIDSEIISRYLRNRVFRELQWIPHLNARIFWKPQWSTGLEVTVQLFNGPFPTIAFVRHQALQHRERRSFGPSGRLQFNGAGEGRNPIEVGFL